MEETKHIRPRLHRLKDSINKMKQHQIQQNGGKTQKKKQPAAKPKISKEKCPGKKRKNENHLERLRKKQNRQGERFRQEHRISVGSQIRWTWQSKKTSRRKKQGFKRRERKQRDEFIKQLLTKYRAATANRTRWTEASVLNSIETAYGFVAYYIKTKCHKASLHFASMR